LFSFSTIIILTDFLFSLVGVLLRVAFFTLIERKIIGLIHYRKGPNKVILRGVSQPISDALKLLTKEAPKFYFLKAWIFSLGPNLIILLITLCWGWYEYRFSISSNSFKIIIILAIIGLSAYGFLLTRWGSNSKYSIIGGLRAIAQVISYEVCLILYIMVIIYISKSYRLQNLSFVQDKIWMIIIISPLFFTWVVLCIAETNRTPFDLAEGESEIVSGFNIEYGGGLFALIFIREYGIIIFLRFLTSVLFIGARLILLKTFILCILFVWVRCCFPRVRYDQLIIISWKLALPYRLAVLGVSLTI